MSRMRTDDITADQLRERLRELPSTQITGPLLVRCAWLIITGIVTVPLRLLKGAPPELEKMKRKPGLGALGNVRMSDGFDEPLPESFWLGEESEASS